jgi:hypothetical protein
VEEYLEYGERETWRQGLVYTGPPGLSECLLDLFQSSTSIGEFFRILWDHPILLIKWFEF